MPRYSYKSLYKLEECHPKLIGVFKEVIEHFDHTILEGHRGQAEQDKAYDTGHSGLRYPKSMHNKKPSLAVDATPYPIAWNDRNRMYYFAGFVKGIALAQGVKIRWGGDWDSDWKVNDQSFFDLPHFELIL